jgi:hypothetical protein
MGRYKYLGVQQAEWRFWAKVRIKEGCWEWTAGKGDNGYGHFHIRIGLRIGAHRMAWSLFNNQPFPEGLQAMHSCNNKGCVNPMHIVPGTAKQNIQDALRDGLKKTGKDHPLGARSHCKFGHEYNEVNTYWSGSGRVCRECRKAVDKRRRPAKGKPLKTHCLRGHLFDEANTRVTKDGKRCCKTCHRAHSLESSRRSRAVVPSRET